MRDAVMSLFVLLSKIYKNILPCSFPFPLPLDTERLTTYPMTGISLSRAAVKSHC